MLRARGHVAPAEEVALELGQAQVQVRLEPRRLGQVRARRLVEGGGIMGDDVGTCGGRLCVCVRCVCVCVCVCVCGVCVCVCVHVFSNIIMDFSFFRSKSMQVEYLKCISCANVLLRLLYAFVVEKDRKKLCF